MLCRSDRESDPQSELLCTIYRTNSDCYYWMLMAGLLNLYILEIIFKKMLFSWYWQKYDYHIIYIVMSFWPYHPPLILMTIYCLLGISSPDTGAYITFLYRVLHFFSVSRTQIQICLQNNIQPYLHFLPQLFLQLSPALHTKPPPPAAAWGREVKPKPECRKLSQLLNLSTRSQHSPLKINHAGKTPV